MGSSLSKPESSFRKSLGKRIDSLIKPKPSGQTTPAPASSAPSPSPHPIASSDPNAGSTAGLGPPPVPPTPRLSTPAPATPARGPSPAPSTSPPAKSAVQSPPALSTNPTQTTSPTGPWVVLATSLRALHRSTKLFPPVQSAVGLMIDSLDLMQQLAENHDEREELASELTRLSNLMVRHMEQSNSEWMTEAVANVARGIEAQVRMIEGRRNRGVGWELLEANAEQEQLSKCYRQIGSLFRELQADASMSIWKAVNDQTTNSLLDRLAPVHLATHNSNLSTSISRRTCTANTRTAILSGLDRWSRNPADAAVYWMNGMAGTGKTTIACTFAESLDEREELAASFFCTRTVPECRVVTRILPTIAYQLARSSIPFRIALCKSLEDHPDTSTANLRLQFDRLLKGPLSKVEETPSHLVVVIDALDECDDMRAVEELLSLLLTGASSLPLRFFVTSRPEPEIYDRMMSRDQTRRGVLHLHEVEKSLVRADIELYLQAELEPMAPAEAEIQQLVDRAGTLFIYAATLVRYIQPKKLRSNPRRRLQSVLAMTWVSTSQYAAIDGLYTAVLAAGLDETELDTAEVEDVRGVLHTVVCAQEPLSVDALTVLSGLVDETQTRAALQRLRAVLHISETSGLVSTLHASFPDFMFDKARSQSYHCEQPTFGQSLAGRCLEVMKTQLRFNICNLESSFVPDSKVENLGERLGKAVSPALWYTCQYWAEHLKNSNYSDLLCSELEGFLSTRLLFWMEVMNLKQRISAGPPALAKAKLWVSTGSTSSDSSRYVEDARKFVASFAANPVSQSTPHIYISSLPFCPKSSSVFKEYDNKMKGLINLTGGALEGRETAMIASWTVESGVNAIAPSPDGSRIAYGCENGTLAVRTLDDGILAMGPLEGHTDRVHSVSYSPDGSRIASCSDDNTIRIWNSQNGTMALGPLQGHTGPVMSVAYSPDGTRIASGSDDNTIRIWSAEDGALVAGPLESHTKKIWAIAYSPDGTRLVSGSEDKTVQVWNAKDGTSVTSPLTGHTDSVWSVAYSPNGVHIISSSRDQTIRVWDVQDGTVVPGILINRPDGILWAACSPDSSRIVGGCGDNGVYTWNAQDGTLVAGPFQGHTDTIMMVAYSPGGNCIISGSNDSTIRVWDAQGDTSVTNQPDSHTGVINSVAYSPDGTRIVSGSSDCSIRVWRAQNGSLIVGPLEGHTGSVTSVAYSPAGTRIVSGSEDRTIRVWNVHDGALAVGPLEGHTGSVRSVGYSPDSTRIVSGSDDHTIRVWDAEDGTLVAGPLTGHTNWVRSVVYSPDGTRIASGSYDRTIRVWNAHDGTLDVGPLEGHSNWVMTVAYSPDGTRIASGSADKTIRVWGAKDGALVAGPLEGHTNWIWSVGYSPDGTRIVSGSWDKTIRVWNAEDGTLVAGPFNGHTSGVYSVAYSPDGTSIVSGSSDQTILVWSARDGVSAPSSQVEGHTDLETIDSIASGASTDSSGWLTTSDSRLLLWVPPEVQPRDMLSQSRCRMAIGPAGSVVVEYDELLLGRRWAECYQP